MKTLYKLFFISLCGAFLFISCNKDGTLSPESDQMQENLNPQSLTRAQIWIRDHAPATKTISNWIPQWEDAFSTDVSDLEVIEIPLSFLSEQVFVSADCQEAYRITGKTKYLQNQTRLIYEYNKKTKKERAFFMTVSPSRKYLEKADFKLKNNSYQKPAKDFDGRIIYSDLNGLPISGQKYESGKLRFYFRPQSPFLTKAADTGFTTYCETTYTIHYIEWTYNNNDNVDYQYLYTEVSEICWSWDEPSSANPDGPGGSEGTPGEGDWWGFGHRLIFANALSSYLTDKQIDEICRGSEAVDTKQETEYAHTHAMLTPGQTLEQGVLALRKFFQEEATKFRGNGDYLALGKALHPIQDAYSPAHAFNTWSVSPGDYVPHAFESITYYPNHVARAILETQRVYNEVISGDGSAERMNAIFDAWYYRYQNP